MRGENVYLNPYSHIDQSPVEVRLARDNNGPDLATRHVSVLLSFYVIDPAGLLSAAWIHSWASSPQHTAVTRHKEGSISTAPGIVCTPPTPTPSPPPTCVRLQNHSISRWGWVGAWGGSEAETHKGTETTKGRAGRNGGRGGGRKAENGEERQRVDSGTPGT